MQQDELSKPTETELDTNLAKKAFDRLRPELMALPTGDLPRVNCNLYEVAAVVMGVVAKLNHPKLREPLASVRAKNFDPACLDELAPMALATWHTHLRFVQATTSADGRTIPAALIDEATFLRNQMLKVVQFYQEVLPECTRELASIQGGQGYLDLGADLGRLADLYEAHADVFADTQYFRAADAARARHLSIDILKARGTDNTEEQRYWAEMQQRALRLLQLTYNQLRAAAQLVFCHAPNLQAAFPSLVTAARKPAHRVTPVEPEAPVAEADLTPDTTNTSDAESAGEADTAAKKFPTPIPIRVVA